MIIKEIFDGKNKNNIGIVVPLLKFANSKLNSRPVNPFADIFSAVIACPGFAIRIRKGHSSGILGTRLGCF